MGTLTWELWLRNFGLRTLAWELCLGNFGLGALAWELRLGILRLESCGHALFLGTFRLGLSMEWGAGGIGLRILGESAGAGSESPPPKSLSKNPSRLGKKHMSKQKNKKGATRSERGPLS